MPQLIGGKKVFGLSRVGSRGQIVIPAEAFNEYELGSNNKVIIISGTRLSGGFELTTPKIIEKSPPLKKIFNDNPKLAEFKINRGRTIEYKGKEYCWVELRRDHSIIIPPVTLMKWGVKPGDLLAAVSGGYLKLSFPSKGPTVDRAKKSPDVRVYEDMRERDLLKAKQTKERREEHAAKRRAMKERRKPERKTEKKEPVKPGAGASGLVGIRAAMEKLRKK